MRDMTFLDITIAFSIIIKFNPTQRYCASVHNTGTQNKIVINTQSPILHLYYIFNHIQEQCFNHALFFLKNCNFIQELYLICVILTNKSLKLNLTMNDIAKLLHSLIEQHRSSDIAESEFKRMLNEDLELKEIYNNWCDENGYSPRNGYKEYIQEIFDSQESIWDSFISFEDEN